MTTLGGIVNGAKSKNKMRAARGGAIALSTGLALALVVLGLGFVALVLIMGAENETRNAVDSGTLNIGKQALDQVKVLASLDPTSWTFATTTDDSNQKTIPDGQMSLRRINKLWGAALLIAINAEAAQNDGNAGSGDSNAQQACQTAQQISDSLADRLTQKSNLFGFFNSFSMANSVRMMGLGTKTEVSSNGDWRTSLVKRTESNLVITGKPPNFNLPPGYKLDSSAYTQCSRTPMPSGAQGMYFLKGYTPITAAGQTFWQTSFQYGMKPYLIAQSSFNKETSDAESLDWSKPVPNAFSAQGVTNKAGAINETAAAYVLTNPNQPFQLSLPHSFLRIHVDKPTSHWYFFPSIWPPTQMGEPDVPYGYIPDEYSNFPMPGGGILCTTVTPDEITLGLDVVGRPLDQIIFSYPDGDTSSTEAYMVNRCNEMITSVGTTISASAMHDCLRNPINIAALAGDIKDFVVYSPDGKTLSCEPLEVAAAHNPWLLPIMSNDPDGSEKELVNTTDMAPIFGVPIIIPDVGCTQNVDFSVGEYGKKVGWTPGSGSNGCLGTIHVTRWTDVYNVAACNPL